MVVHTAPTSEPERYVGERLFKYLSKDFPFYPPRHVCMIFHKQIDTGHEEFSTGHEADLL